MFIALDKAIRDLLLGNPRDKQGNPVNPSVNPGLRIPLFDTRQNDVRTEQFNPFKPIPNRYQQIPVYKTSTAGVDYEKVNCSVTYELVSFMPRFDQWLPNIPANRILVPNASPTLSAHDRAGAVVATGQATNKTRPFAESYDVLVQFDVRARIQYEGLLILRALLALFPQRHFIQVPLADGTYHVCDMLQREVINLTGDEVPSLEQAGNSQGEYRSLRYVLSYVVEAYMDTTEPLQVEESSAVQAVSLQGTFTNSPNAANVNNQAGVLEIIDLTKLM